MAPLATRLKQVLEAGLQQGQAHLDTLSNQRVYGQVVSPEFDGQDYEARRGRIREVLDQAQQAGVLTREDLAQISTLLTYTPDEWSATLESA
jgi:acid stress-induced BolA-like protein IbaG/YrbA